MIIVFDLTLNKYIQDIKTTFIANLCLTYSIFYNWAHVVSKWADKIILRNEILTEILWNLRKQRQKAHKLGATILPPNSVSKPIYWFFLKWSTLGDAKPLPRSICFNNSHYRKSRKMDIIPPYSVILGKLLKHYLTFHSIILVIYWEDKRRIC